VPAPLASLPPRIHTSTPKKRLLPRPPPLLPPLPLFPFPLLLLLL
jgi:hypothetical protein